MSWGVIFRTATPGFTKSNTTGTAASSARREMTQSFSRFLEDGRDFTNRFPGIRDAVLTLPCKSAVIDGEVVACKKDGTPDFRAPHSGNYTQELLCVWAFDLMQLSGEDLRPFPLVARKRKLDVILRRHA